MQKRPIILRSLPIVATPYPRRYLRQRSSQCLRQWCCPRQCALSSECASGTLGNARDTPRDNTHVLPRDTARCLLNVSQVPGTTPEPETFPETTQMYFPRQSVFSPGGVSGNTRDIALDNARFRLHRIAYGVATISRLLKLLGLFCRISSLFYRAFL